MILILDSDCEAGTALSDSDTSAGSTAYARSADGLWNESAELRIVTVSMKPCSHALFPLFTTLTFMSMKRLKAVKMRMKGRTERASKKRSSPDYESNGVQEG